MRNLGVGIAIDDFGAGGTALAHLRDSEVDILKLDRSLIGRLGSHPADVAIVRAVIDLAHDLRLTILAKGVETETQHRFLAELGCDLGQGFFYGRPAPLSAPR